MVKQVSLRLDAYRRRARGWSLVALLFCSAALMRQANNLCPRAIIF